MAKAASPIRLQAELMQAATIAAQRLHRSAAEQIEYWASLGRSVSNSVNPDNLLEVTAGLAEIKIVPIKTAVPIKPDDVFASIEHDRQTQQIVNKAVGNNVHYQSSPDYSGQLERINSDGSKTTGQFSMGIFTELEHKV